DYYCSSYVGSKTCWIF
nr:immunoglobulin light chain junction region [Macaca mulatta]MOW28905.1 immunoglobulin light chain junction region [Macaca mulatta]MOW29883.1 immunoglobulin light chain junction region [Macaca mulatta]